MGINSSVPTIFVSPMKSDILIIDSPSLVLVSQLDTHEPICSHQHVYSSSEKYGHYVAILPNRAHPHLKCQLGWVDLCEIARHMLDWEERLCTHLGLTEVDVHGIKAMHFDNPPLQR